MFILYVLCLLVLVVFGYFTLTRSEFKWFLIMIVGSFLISLPFLLRS